MNRLEVLAFCISMFSFCAGVIHQVWRISQAVSEIKHTFEKQDLRLENLHDVQELSFNGLKERFEHFTGRMKGDVQDVNARLGSIEDFLAKTTTFVKRR